METGFHNALKGILSALNSVIVDNALITPTQRSSFNAAVDGFKILRVGKSCDINDPECRERVLGDRATGTAAYEAARVHLDMDYDLSINTTDVKYQ